MATIAERAGVHTSTVSRALQSAGGPGARAKTLEILRIAEELGYRPNPMASALRLRRTRLVGMLVPRLTDYVLARIYEGVDDTASARGYTSYVANTADDPALRAARLEDLLARRPDGILLGDARLSGDELVKTLKRRGMPYVLTSRRLRGHLSVTTDDLAGGRLAGEHLAGLGHASVGVIAGEPYASTGVERTRGFLKAMEAAGAPVPTHLVVDSRFDAEGGRAAAEQLLAAAPGLTAIFATNDTAAIGAMGAIRAIGARVGEDIAVVGYNDIPICAQLPVPLTSVASPMFEMGHAAATALIDRIGGEDVRSRRLEPTLVPRASSLGQEPA